MPIIKAHEPLPEGPVVIGIYGEPGVSKTSIANTAENPLLCDFDRGSRRSMFRKDTLILTSWEDVITEEKADTFKGYKTIIIDTAKAALDDFLMTYVVKQDFKLQKNKLQAYGAIGDAFKLFLNSRRNEGADVIIIAHGKKDEDTKKMLPDVTGQSYNLMLRVCDQLGYVSMINNKRTIQFSPTDLTVGKNTAALATIEIPDKSDPAIQGFMADIIKQTKSALARQSEAQVEALQKSEALQGAIKESETFEDLGLIIPVLLEQPQYLQEQIKQVLVMRGIEFIKKISTPEKLTEALTFFSTPPLVVSKPVFAELQATQKKNSWKYNQEEKKFFSDAPPPPAEPVKEKITEPAKEQELSFA